MKSLMILWQEAANELAAWCRTSASMDIKTLHARVEHEGFSFLTITLSDFCKDLQKGLDRGYVDHDLFKSFSFSGGLPRFLGGFLDLVFDRGTGRLLSSPSVDAIFALRQLTLMFGKISLPCSDARVASAMKGYVECENQIKEMDAKRDRRLYDDFRKMSTLIWGDVLQKVDEDIYYLRITPKHGPGATADRLKGNLKYDQRIWHQRLDRVFPVGDFLLPNARYFEHLDQVDLIEPRDEQPVRVIQVPKTLKTPRIIAIEPTCMQYAQQGLMEKFVQYIEGDSLTSMYVGFTDQGPNQALAREGSHTGTLATLDLSEASDRVSNQLVREMTANFPNLQEGIDACRSRKADVLGHGVLRLAKFASMGSALTFPIEAMVFTTVILLGIQKELERPLTRKDIKSLAGQVRVYGDDIIVPVDFVRSVVEELEAFGFRVNLGKSFWTGKFRESCGKDYYDGTDVSVVRVRREFPVQRSDVSEISKGDNNLRLLSLVSLRNQFFMIGMWSTCRWLDEQIGKYLPHFPAVLPTSPVLGRTSSLGYDHERDDRDLHRPLVKGYVVSSRPPKSPLDGAPALLKAFLKRGELPFADRNHLERYGRPDAVDIKLRWGSPV